MGGLRAYEHFWTADRMFLFLGVEADYIDFKGEASRGSGVAGELFCGFEYVANFAFTFYWGGSKAGKDGLWLIY